MVGVTLCARIILTINVEVQFMSLLKCPECNHDVSEYANACPNCGCPIDIIKNKTCDNCLEKVILQDVGDYKVKVIALVREVTGLGLKEAKDVIDNAPTLLFTGMTTQKADNIKSKFKNLGATIVVEDDTDSIEEKMVIEPCKIKQSEQYSITQQQDSKQQPHCPVCNSTNIQKISVASKAVGAGLFGIFSKTARSQFECKDCGYKF